MKAIQYTAFDASQIIQLNDIEKPSLKQYEVLIKVAVTVNPANIKSRTGSLQ